MITGFNTDIIHDGVTYHVQTEDKGVETPLILSLVYNRGTILASKRTPYEDLIQKGFDEKVLSERLQKQHKLICAAVRAGRIEELKRMTAKDAAIKKEAKLQANGHAPRPPIQQIPPIQPQIQPKIQPIEKKAEIANVQPPQFVPASANFANSKVAQVTQELKSVTQELKSTSHTATQELKSTLHTATTETYAQAIPQPKETFVPAIPQPKEELIWDLPLEIIEDDLIVDVGNIIEAETILAADAVEIISDLNSSSSKLRLDNLEIEFLNETTFKAGERKTLNIRVFRGHSTNFIREAQVMVKVLGSSFRPLIFHARTNDAGIAVVHLQLPQFRSGRGAILVRAISNGEEAELRQIVRQG